MCTPNRDPTPLRREVLKLEGSYRVTNMPVYFGMYLLQQMTLAAIFSWWLAPLVSKRVKSKFFAAPLFRCCPVSALPPARWTTECIPGGYAVKDATG